MTRNALAKRTAPRTGSGRVLVFPTTVGGTSSGSTGPIGTTFAFGESEGLMPLLRQTIEGAINQAVLLQQLRGTLSGDSPFGPVYISALAPDPLDSVHLSNLVAVSGVEDRSGEISFADDEE